MVRDDKHGAPDPHSVGDDENDDGESHAADEPTAVWDESALRAAGLGDLWRRREAEPPSAAERPSTVPAASSADPSIVIEETIEPAPAASPVMIRAAPQAAASGGLGWGATVAIAVALGAIMYGLIRYLKG